MTDDIIFHLVPKQDWKTYQNAGLYEPPSLEEEGFIHCSNGSQVQEVANKYFKDAQNLLLIVIDVASLEADVKMEQVNDSNEKYPHIMGKLNIDAIIDKIELAPEKDGNYYVQFSTEE